MLAKFRPMVIFLLLTLILTACVAPTALPSTPTATITSTPANTPVPTGIFPMLMFYEPLVLHYDPSLWIDQTQYNDPNYLGYGLQSTRLQSCKIGIQGPTDLNDRNAFTSTETTLGSIQYSIIQFKETNVNGQKIAWYMPQDQSIPGFSFENGTPVLVLMSSPAEWTPCQKLAEDVFAALSMPAPALKMESYEIKGKIDLEPMHFTTTTGQIFTSRATPYNEPGFPDRSYFDKMTFCIKDQLKGAPLIACQVFIKEGTGSKVVVTHDGKGIYSIPTGNIYAAGPLQGLWVYGNHWALETINITTHTNNNQLTADLIGQLTVDGVLINDKFNYQEVFGFQTLAGRPFYFFKRDGKIGYSYDGVETMLDFDSIRHYACCSAGALNPQGTPNHVDFFAKKGSTDYFVILGIPPR